MRDGTMRSPRRVIPRGLLELAVRLLDMYGTGGAAGLGFVEEFEIRLGERSVCRSRVVLRCQLEVVWGDS